MRCCSPVDLSDSDSDVQLIVPCGKCIFCLSNRRDDWSFRLFQEFRRSKSAAFITLTYSPKFVPDCGLVKRHFQLFMKRLRKKSGDRLRYYAVGEYGTKTLRPHYHAIIFNYKGNEKFLQSIWSAPKTREPYGIVHIGKVNEASIRYTTKYIIQGPETVPKGFSPPFALMSRAYGLGACYLTDSMVSWHREDNRNFAMMYDQKIRLPRFYKDKIWPLVKSGPQMSKWNEMRKSVSDAAMRLSQDNERENFRILLEAGYNPYQIMKEMREAVRNRVKQKIAFTQKF